MTAHRRMCAVASVLALVVVLPTVARTDSAPSADADVAVLTPDGVLTVFDMNGIEVGQVETGTSWPKMASFAADGRVVVLDDEQHRALLVDASTGRVDRYVVPDDASLSVVGSADSKIVAVLSNYGTWNGVLVSPSRDAAVDLGSIEIQRLFDEAPLFVQWSVAASIDGATAVLADYASRSSLVVSFVGADAFVVPGTPMGFAGDRLVTAEHRGETGATIRYFAADGTEVASFDTDAQSRRVLLEGGEFISIDAAGTISRLSPEHAEPEVIGSIELAGETIQYVVAFDAASRLLVGTDESVRLVGIDGVPIREFSPVETDPPWLSGDPHQRCVTVGSRSFTTFELATGVERSVLTGFAVNVLSDDGCTILVTGSTGETVVRGAVVTRLPDGDSLLAASGDARLAVLFGDQLARIVNLDDPDDDGIILKLDDQRVPRVVFLRE